MRGKIDEDGFLFIKRRQFRMKRMYCRRNSGCCGDTCPLFGDPISGGSLYPKGTMLLKICERNTLVFDQFVDERKEKKGE